jgi:hypothetical protein
MDVQLGHVNHLASITHVQISLLVLKYGRMKGELGHQRDWGRGVKLVFMGFSVNKKAATAKQEAPHSVTD